MLFSVVCRGASKLTFTIMMKFSAAIRLFHPGSSRSNELGGGFFSCSTFIERFVPITRPGVGGGGAVGARSIRRENRPTKLLMIFALTAEAIASDRISSESSEGRERERARNPVIVQGCDTVFVRSLSLAFAPSVKTREVFTCRGALRLSCSTGKIPVTSSWYYWVLVPAQRCNHFVNPMRR